jgi:hypothetical protein
MDIWSIKSCINGLRDGTVLCKLVGQEVPGLIDTRVVNKKPKKNEQITQNLNLAINAASILGCDTDNISANDFLERNVFNTTIKVK